MKTATEPTRRSTRTSGQPKNYAEDDVKERKPRATKTGKKRGADRDDTEEGPVKKSKGEDNAQASDEGNEESSTNIDIPHIDIGDVLPSLLLKNEKGEDIDVATLTSEKGLVLFLVPKADTPGCTTQACGFRDIYPDFTSSDYEVYCLSADVPTAQTKWQTKKALPYPLLSDPKRVLIKALGAGEGGKTKRSHFIFEKGGKLLNKKIPVKPADSPKLALEFVKGLVAA